MSLQDIESKILSSGSHDKEIILILTILIKNNEPLFSKTFRRFYNGIKQKQTECKAGKIECKSPSARSKRKESKFDASESATSNATEGCSQTIDQVKKNNKQIETLDK